MLRHIPALRYPGQHKRPPHLQVQLAVQVLDNRHGSAILARMRDVLGDRADVVGPLDMSRNVLRSYVLRICQARAIPPLATGLGDELAAAMGDHSGGVTVVRYAAAGGRPLPTTVAQEATYAHHYQEGAGYAGVMIGWSRRANRVYLQTIAPDMLELEYSDDDPTEPVVIRHHGARAIGGRDERTVDVYDLTDLDAPAYRVMRDKTDITEEVHGETYDGDRYPWRYEDGRPYHRIIVTGHPRHIYDRTQQVEASLVVPVRWTAWGSGTDNASHPQRNVSGMSLDHTDSDAGTGQQGASTGPETVLRWVHDDPEAKGEHWQDAPAYDPLGNAKAIGFYESLTMSLIDLPIQLDASGGEPTAREQEALENRIRSTYAECRRLDSEILSRAAALVNRRLGTTIPEQGYTVAYREEVQELLTMTQAEPETSPYAEPPPGGEE